MRWKTAVAVVVLTGSTLWAADDKPVRFAKDDVGKVPAGWQAAKTGSGQGSVWMVVEDDTTPSKSGYALAQTAESPSSLFNVCVKDEGKFKDVDLSVSFKAMAGKRDQGGGFVWRYQDNNNYYICRMNPLEDNFRLYKVVAGKRIQLATSDAKVPAGEWHTIKINAKGEQIECSLDGKKHLEAKDDAFKQAGKVGLWSKADAQTHFDSFTVSPK